jgi:hypothetical protein
MIELVERVNIFENKKIIQSIVSEIQKIFFDKYIYESIDDERGREIYISAFDVLNYEIIPLKSNEIKLSVDNIDITTHSNILFQKIIKLLDLIDVKNLYVLSCLKTDFFHVLCYNKYKPLVTALGKLREIVGKDNYMEALIVNKMDIKNIIEIVFLLGRCDPEMDNILLFDKMERYYFSICKHGNIHFVEINGNNIVEEKITDIGFKIVEKCYDEFSETGKIEGRKIEL